jgi:hypothetical protein
VGPDPTDQYDSDTDELLEQLARAVREHSELLARQQVLIEQLREELRDVAR